MTRLSSASVTQRAAFALAVGVLLPTAATAQTNWTGNGSNTDWSNPDNWFVSGPPNDLPPDGSDPAIFRPQYTPSNAVVTLDLVHTEIFSLRFRDDEAFPVPGSRANTFVTLNGAFGHTLTVNHEFTLGAAETLIDTGVVDITINDLDVSVGSIVIDPTEDDPGIHRLTLNNSDFTVRSLTADFNPVNFALEINDGSVVTGSDETLFTPGTGSWININNGGVLDWATFNARNITFDAGGGFIYNDFSSTGDIFVFGTNTGAVFGDVDSTVAHSGAISGSISGTGGVVVNSDLFSLYPFLNWDLTDLYTTGVITIVSTGDANFDGFVNIEDLDLVLANWGTDLNTRGLSPPPGDVTGDFAVNNDDLQAIINNWGTTVPPAAAPIPEPTSAALLGCTALALPRRRRAA